MKNSNFRDNVVIVTGASSGIGRQLAIQLSNQGASLALAARDTNRLEEIAAQCHHRDCKALVVPTDITQQSACQHLVNRTVDEFGRIDTLINNAGIAMRASFDQVEDLDKFDEIMRVNYFGSMYCTYYALPYLKRTRGRIVGVSSLAGKTGIPLISLYAASKHAMTGFFDSLRIELADHGVSVTMIYPAFVDTEIAQRAIGPDGKPLGVSATPRRKVMTAEMCARMIIKAAARRRRRLLMTAQGKIGLWLKVIAPSVVDRMARRAMERND